MTTEEDKSKKEKLLAELSSEFVAVESHEVDRAINQGLKRLGEFLGADRASMGRFTANRDDLVSTHVWALPGIEPMPATPLPERFPWIMRQMQHGRPVVFSRPDELPQEEQFDRTTGGSVRVQPRGDDAGIVHYEDVPGAQILDNVAEHAVRYGPRRAVEHHQPGFVATRSRSHGDEFLRQFEIE